MKRNKKKYCARSYLGGMIFGVGKGETMKHIMLDLETMSTASNAAIVAIGAVEFEPETGKLGREFYCNVSLASC